MAISFPASPSINQQYSFGGRTWFWTGVVWQSLGTIQGFIGTQGAIGRDGIQGLQGNQGVQGLLGFQGIQGQAVQGIQGGQAFVTYGVTPPVAPAIGDRWIDAGSGSEYTWVFDGNSYQWVELSASGFSGVQGLQGPAGAGSQGIQGPAGTVQGVQGTQGFGTQGAVGLQGTQGLQGFNAGIAFGVTPPSTPMLGDRWVDANSGSEYTWMFDGNSSQWVEVSASGFSGTQGTQGATGIGAQGAQGAIGLQGFGYAQLQGIQGIQGTNGNNGAQGPVGFQGLQGFGYSQLQGVQGPAGAGAQGAQGLQGFVGIQGPLGYGLQGSQGVQGIPGIAVGQTFTNVTFNGDTSIGQMFEQTTINASSVSSTVTYNLLSQAGITLNTAGSSANWTLNVRGDASNTLNSLLGIGQSFTLVFIVQQTATPYYMTTFQIDGVTTTVRWNGVAPSSGTVNGIDAYSFSILKTAAATYTVVGAMTRYS